ncbi:MAG: TRAP transporter large permease subunit [Deltaproteobacteria bacterium]|nr:TRAP transporter large permease subunit [Deltaproteobacteria bacterium]
MDSDNRLIDSNEIPNLDRFISALEKIIPVTRWLFYISGGILALYTLFVVVDVVLRYVFNQPLRFGYDIGGMVMTVFLFLAAAYVQVEKGHIEIDIITARFPQKTKLLLSCAMYIICMIVTGVIVWKSSLTAISYLQLGSKAQSGLPLFPSASMIPIGALFLFIIYIRDVLSKIRECIDLRPGPVAWLLAAGAPLLFLLLTSLITLHVFPGIGSDISGYISIALLFLFMFLGMPLAIAFILFSVALAGFSSGPNAGLMLVGKTLYTQTASYDWSVIPLFTLMSFIFMESGMGTNAYRAAYTWFGSFRGGLAIATIVACTAFASVNGGPLPAIIIMGTVGLSEMRRYKYADELSTGSILAGATLGPIIPPSVPFIIYGVICRESIGDLFIAGIIPGALLALSFIVVIMIMCLANPRLGPAGERSGWNEKLRSTPKFLPILALFILVIGGIYAGVFSAMEGGGIGAFGALVIAVASRSFSWKKFISSLIESTRTNSMLLFVIIAGLIFGNGLGASGLSSRLVEAIQGLGLSPMMFVGLILVIYLIFGIICDAPIILLLTLPVLAPMVKGMGVDMIWFGVLATLIANLGAVTPPFAIGIFMLKNISPSDLTISSIYRGVMPFCIATLIVTLLIMFYPGLATWLPALMMK